MNRSKFASSSPTVDTTRFGWKLLLTASTSLLMSGVGIVPALAQDAPATPEVAASPPAQEASDTSGDEEIIVTANRTATSLSRTPVAVTAVTGAALVEAGITNPTLLADHVPSLAIDRANGLQITIRGVSSTDNTEKGDPSAAFLLDGIYIARPQAQEVSFFDLERVEVLRGPQGTLYGRNTTAGLINVISARPQMKFGASVDATAGNFGTYQVTGMVNAPLGESFAMRAAVNYDRRDSYLIENPDSQVDLDPGKENFSGRLSFLADLGPVEVLVRGDYSTIKGSLRESVLTSNLFQFPFDPPVSSPPAPANLRGVDPEYIGGSSKDRRRLTYVDEVGNPPHVVPTDTDDSTWGVMGEVNWSISEPLTLTYLGSYREFKRREAFPLFIGRVPGFTLVSDAIFNGDYWQNSQELRLSYDGDRLDLQGGVYYFKEKSGILLALLGLNDPTPGEDGYVFGFPQSPTISESLAFFGQGTFSLTDTFRLTAGVRYTKDDKSRAGATINHRTLDEDLDFVLSPTNPRPDSLNLADVHFKETTWKAGFEFDLAPRTLLYGSVATGYKAGGFNDGCLATDDFCNQPVTPEALFYDPEKLTAYELGLKTRFAGDAGRLFVNAFHYKYTDLQLSAVANVCGGPCQVTTNAGKARVNGVEVEGEYRIGDRTTVSGSAAWLDAQYTDYEIVPGVNFEGEPLNRSPDWTFTLDIQHTIPLGNSGGITLDLFNRYSDEYFIISSPLRAMFRQPSFIKTDFNITYRSPEDRWYLGAFVKNIENKVTISNASVGPAYPGLNDGESSLSPPRTFGARAGVRF